VTVATSLVIMSLAISIGGSRLLENRRSLDIR